MIRECTRKRQRHRNQHYRDKIKTKINKRRKDKRIVSIQTVKTKFFT